MSSGTNEFKLVVSKKRRHRIIDKVGISDFSDCNHIDKSSILRKIELATEEIKGSEFYSSLNAVLAQALKLIGNSSVEEIICYGLGHFTDCIISRYQLGLLLLLKQQFNAKVLVFDPIFSSADCDLLQKLNCLLITENEEGKRKVALGVSTLVYLPHCPKQLTNNFLWSNWGPHIEQCVLLCNSFSSVIERHPHRTLHTDLAYIANIFPYTEEFDIVNTFKYQDIFNDLSVHIFSGKKISLATNLWSFNKPPIYSPEDTEFITKEFQSQIKITS